MRQHVIVVFRKKEVKEIGHMEFSKKTLKKSFSVRFQNFRAALLLTKLLIVATMSTRVSARLPATSLQF